MTKRKEEKSVAGRNYAENHCVYGQGYQADSRGVKADVKNVSGTPKTEKESAGAWKAVGKRTGGTECRSIVD